MRKIGCLVVLLLGVIAGWMLRDRFFTGTRAAPGFAMAATSAGKGEARPRSKTTAMTPVHTASPPIAA